MSTIDEQLYGTDMFGHSMRPAIASPVAQKFLVSPFSVLNAREGDWQERKRAWSAIGIKGEIGRDAPPGGSAMPATDYSKSGARGYGDGKPIPGTGRLVTGKNCTTGKNSCMFGKDDEESGGGVTSIFDPVLCELAYRWWSGKEAQIIDPFAGGSVRGIVAAHLGRKYWGCDLRREQIEANKAQGIALCEGKQMPQWVCGDSFKEVENAPDADFVFSCPPYGDLEVYSDLPDDLSAMKWPDFLTAYRAIIAKSCAKLRNNRFACFVVGDFRDGRGNYRNFVSETIGAFLSAGLSLYNEAILVTSVGSASMRVTRQFNGGRKLCKTHQNVLVFVKGDGKAAADAASSGLD